MLSRNGFDSLELLINQFHLKNTKKKITLWYSVVALETQQWKIPKTIKSGFDGFDAAVDAAGYARDFPAKTQWRALWKSTGED